MDKSGHHDAQTTQTIIAEILGAGMWFITPSALARIVVLACAVLALVYIFYKGHYVRDWSTKKKNVVAPAVGLVLLFAGMTCVVPQWRKEHPLHVASSSDSKPLPSVPTTQPIPEAHSLLDTAPPAVRKIPHRQNRQPSPNTTSQSLAYGREPVPKCPPEMQMFYLSESSVSDNDGCAYSSPTPACVIVENHSFIQRNTGGGVCIGSTRSWRSSPSQVQMDGVAEGMGRMINGKCSLVLQSVKISGFHTGLTTVGKDGACIDIENTTIEQNGTGISADQLAAPTPTPKQPK